MATINSFDGQTFFYNDSSGKEKSTTIPSLQNTFPNSDVFIAATNCSGQSNCVQWVDDNTTDNCTAATTSWLSAINSYSGPGLPQVFIQGSGAGKAFKFASANCHLEFDIPVSIHLWATINCAQPSGNNCIQFGPTVANGSTGYTIAQTFKYTIDGGGTLTGGANLTNAGIEVESTTVDSLITGLNFVNFGATNATIGSCTNYAVLYDYAIAGGIVSYNHWQVTDNGNGRCAFANPNGVTTGSNTILFIGNTIGGQSATNLSGCGSVAIVDGGTLGLVEGNSIYAFGIGVLVNGVGHRILGNEFDNAGCAASTVNSAIQFGGSSAVGPIIISNNNIQIQPGHSTYLFAPQNGTAATIHDITLIGNANTDPTTVSELMMPASLSCTPTVNAGTPCFQYGNVSMNPAVSCGSTQTGWQAENILAGCSSAAQTANLGATTLYTPVFVKAVNVSCQVMLTTVATTSSTLPQCVISYTDFFTNAAQSITVTPTWASGTLGCSGATTNVLGNSCQGSTGVIIPKPNTAVNYSTINYASNSAAQMQYQVFARATIQ